MTWHRFWTEAASSLIVAALIYYVSVAMPMIEECLR
jgi:hypothetical protein